MITLNAGEQLVRDYWPAEASIGATTYRLARVWVTTERVVLIALKSGTPRVDIDHKLDVEHRSVLHRNGVQGASSSIALDDGTTLIVRAAYGCGCHSPLRAVPLPRSS